LHGRFSHPTADALVNVLKRARPADVGTETKKALKDLVRKCQTCQTFASKPAIFKVSLPAEDI